MVEMTIQTDADMVTEEQTDLSEVTPGQRGTSEAEATTDKETQMDLGKTQHKLKRHVRKEFYWT